MTMDGQQQEDIPLADIKNLWIFLIQILITIYLNHTIDLTA
jgi:hypothetical protein